MSNGNVRTRSGTVLSIEGPIRAARERARADNEKFRLQLEVDAARLLRVAKTSVKLRACHVIFSNDLMMRRTRLADMPIDKF